MNEQRKGITSLDFVVFSELERTYMINQQEAKDKFLQIYTQTFNTEKTIKENVDNALLRTQNYIKANYKLREVKS